MVNGNRSFDIASYTISTRWERHTYNCNTGSYDICEYFKGSTHEWRVNETTGQLVLHNDDDEAHSTSVIVSGNKVVITNKFEDEEGPFTVINVLEK